MKRRTIFIAGAAALLAGLGIAAALPGHSLAVPAAARLPITTAPLPFDRDDPAAAATGALRFMGALHLRSTNPLFGGLSGLRWSNGWLLSVSDTGNWVAFRPVERDGRLIGLSDARIAPILMADGRPAADKESGDSESLEWPSGGDATATVFFEQDHRMQVYPGIDPARLESFAIPPARVFRPRGARGWSDNGGGEAFARLDAEAEIVFSEDSTRPGGVRDALLLTGDKAFRLAYVPPERFSPTDAVLLDRDRLLVLNRHFSPASGVAAVLVLVDLKPLNAARAAGTVPLDTPLRWTELARLQSPLTIDNMEGLALRREGARTFLYMVSDDNLNSLQRTILMKFELLLPQR